MKAGYKQTEIGIFPESWNIGPLDSCFDVTSSKRVLQREWETSGIPFYRTRDLVNLHATGQLTPTLFISDKLYKSFVEKYGVPNTGDLLVTGVGSIGIPYVVDHSGPFYFKDGNIIWFKNRGKVKLNSRFLYHLYNSPIIRKQITTESAGTTVDTYTIVRARRTLIPVPSMKEQQAIAEALNDADALIASLEELVSKKQSMKKGFLQEIFNADSKHSRANRNPKLLGEISDITMGQSPISSCYNTQAKGIPLIQGNADIKGRKTIARIYTIHSPKIAEKGSIILTVRAPVGDVAIASEQVCLGRGVCAIRSDQPLLYYFFEFLEGKWGEYATGSTFDSINHDQLSNVPISLPERISDQEHLTSVLDAISEEIRTIKQQFLKATRLKEGMMRELLTGKTRLI